MIPGIAPRLAVPRAFSILARNHRFHQRAVYTTAVSTYVILKTPTLDQESPYTWKRPMCVLSEDWGHPGLRTHRRIPASRGMTGASPLY